MAAECVCDRCGYHPREGDRHEVLDVGLDQLDQVIEYVRCYNCGNEWVE